MFKLKLFTYLLCIALKVLNVEETKHLILSTVSYDKLFECEHDE